MQNNPLDPRQPNTPVNYQAPTPQQQPMQYHPPLGNQPAYYTPAPQPVQQPYYAPQPQPQSNIDWRAVNYYKQLRKKERNDIILKGAVIGATLIVMIIVELIAVLLLDAAGKSTLLDTDPTFANCFNIIAVHVCALAVPFTLMWLILKKKADKPLIPTEKTGKLKAFIWICFGMGCCMAANYITNAVIMLYEAFGYELTQPEFPVANSVISCIALVFSTSIVPGIFEEYAFRCCTLSALRPHGKAFGVIAVSIVFGLIHGNMIQFVFAMLVGLALGFITVRTNSVIPAMIVHALNNGISVLQEILEYTSGEKVAEYVSNGFVIAWIILGIGALAYMLVKKELLPPKQPKQPKVPYALNLAEKLLCLVPGFFIPFVILIYETSQYITKV